MRIWLTAGLIFVAAVTMLCLLWAAVRSGHPLRSLGRSGVFGLCALGLVHLAGAFSGVGLGIGWFTGGVAFLLGVPGVTALMLLNVILK